jgi:hypothetical protein
MPCSCTLCKCIASFNDQQFKHSASRPVKNVYACSCVKRYCYKMHCNAAEIYKALHLGGHSTVCVAAGSSGSPASCLASSTARGTPPNSSTRPACSVAQVALAESVIAKHIGFSKQGSRQQAAGDSSTQLNAGSHMADPKQSTARHSSDAVLYMEQQSAASCCSSAHFYCLCS